ncbi:hypothetical protein, partial [Paraburkholderia sp.]|uniref:hypothetical protein n=1 Tax=Paraburkholderia sp. TaxID=1926495 RepID=UPI002D68AFD6
MVVGALPPFAVTVLRDVSGHRFANVIRSGLYGSRDHDVVALILTTVKESEPNCGRSIRAARRAFGEFAAAEVLV